MTKFAQAEKRSAQHPIAALFLPALALLGFSLAACSNSGSSSGSPAGSKARLEIVNCSLGCVPTDSSVACGPLNTFVNQEISIEFNDEVDIESVNKNSFRVVEVSTGAVPASSFQLDPNNPRRLIYRPALTFDSQGNPVFGFNAGSTYQLTIPAEGSTGAAQGVIRSISGRPNVTSLECSLSASEGVDDLREGKPRVEAFLDTVKSDGTVNPEVLANKTPESKLKNVFRDTRIKLVFNDVMNPATVVNPVTGFASLIQVSIDPDGNADDASDQVPLPGTFTIALDQEAIKTTVTFTPSTGLPSGEAPGGERLLVINLPPGIVDLGGNNLENGGLIVAVPEAITFSPVRLPPGGEDFGDTFNRDEKRTGAFWGPTVPGGLIGALAPGTGGGSGRLGELTVSAGDGPVVFSSDSEVFDGRDLLSTYDEVTGEVDPITVDDGIFEFSTLTINPGAVLRFEGTNAARVFARGTLVVQGTVDVSGETLPLFPSMPCDVEETDSTSEFYCDHLDPEIVGVDPVTEADSIAYLTGTGELDSIFDGQSGGAPGAGGGAGGNGGDLPSYDSLQLPSLSESKGLNNLDAVVDTAGQPGEGVPVPNTLNPVSTAGGGGGGLAWPPTFPPNANDIGDLFEDAFLCFFRQTGGAGAGGGMYTAGEEGASTNYGAAGGGGPTAPPAAGGDPTEIAAALNAETLSPFLGLLRGGAGGGGAGAGVPDSVLNGSFGACTDEANPPIIIDFRSARGGGGGGGGGGIQLQAGHRLVVDGVVDASGGAGGGSGNTTDSVFDDNDRLDDTAPGGAGAGGSILLQGEQVELAPVPGRLRIGGGPIQKGAENTGRGGSGGIGRLRVEAGLTADQLIGFNALKSRVSPTEDEALDAPGAPLIDDLISLVNWRQVGPLDVDPALIDIATTPQPELRSAGQSCWLKPGGNVFLTKLFEDTPSALGWDMDVFIAGFNQSVSYRTPTTLLGGLSPEDFLDLLGASPIQVRFQGARALGAVENPCDALPSGIGSPFVAGSLTPWVRHPAELNDINGSEALRPNWIRYQVVFDRNVTLPDFPQVSALEFFPGITSFYIRAQGE